MNNKINFLEYKQKKDKRQNNNIQELISIIDDFNDNEIKSFNENMKNFQWMIKEIKNNRKINSKDIKVTTEKIIFLQWLSTIINNYCSSNYIDVKLEDDKYNFNTKINIRYDNVYFCFETIYSQNDTTIEVYSTTIKNENIIDLNWIINNKKHPNYENNKITIIKSEIQSLLEIYDIDIDVFKKIVNKFEK